MNNRKKLVIATVSYLSLVFAIFLVAHLSEFNGWLRRVMDIFSPIIIGLVIAYLCLPIMRMFEGRLFVKIEQKRFRRVLALICTYIVLILIFTVLIVLIVPQLVDSILNFIDNYKIYLHTLTSDINELITMINSSLSGKASIPLLDANLLDARISEFMKSVHLDADTLMQFLTPKNLAALIEIASNAVMGIADVIVGLFISIYLLNRKEFFYAHFMRFRRAAFSEKINGHITRVCTIADRSFGGFIKGKLVDSTIVGILVFIIISAFKVPYPLLIATIVAITDIVPVIGPFIGVIPSAVIILLTDPGKFIPFVLIILVVQQIDGNIIAPKILGEHTGVSSLCVMIAILTMGSLWGLLGMVIGVPLFATVIELWNIFLDSRLSRKGLSSNTEVYMDSEQIWDAAKQTADVSIDEDAAKQKKQTIPTTLTPTKEVSVEDLSRFRRLHLETQALLKKYHIIAEKPEDTLARIADEEAILMASQKKNSEGTQASDSAQKDSDENTASGAELT